MGKAIGSQGFPEKKKKKARGVFRSSPRTSAWLGLGGLFASKTHIY